MFHEQITFFFIGPEKSPKFKPYPNWEAHKINSGSPAGKIVSVFRLHVDVCDRLWVLDQGLSQIMGNGRVIKGYSVYVYDLHTDQLIKEYLIPKELLREFSFMANIVVETSKEDCSKAYAYIPDLGGYQMIVYSFHDNDSWKVTHHFFYFDPLKGDYNIGNCEFIPII